MVRVFLIHDNNNRMSPTKTRGITQPQATDKTRAKEVQNSMGEI